MAQRYEGTSVALKAFGDVTLDLKEYGFVALVEMHRPPDNYFDSELVLSLADSLEALDDEPGCRAIVLAADGRNFCAGAQLARDRPSPPGEGERLYGAAVRLFQTRKPVVAAIQGAAIGGGLGLACAADFRVASPETRFAANFARLGFHHGFGLTVTLPALVGSQRALELLYLGSRIDGVHAHSIGLVDRVVEQAELRPVALAMASEIARSAPLAVESIRATMRRGLAEQVRQATVHERGEQDRLRRTSDFTEGVQAAAERRLPHFQRA